jgi:hypothetical protein
MKTKLLLIVAIGLSAVGAMQAADAVKPSGQVTVSFIEPEKFTDVKDGYLDSDKSRDQVLSTLKAHIESLARNYVAEGQHLEVKVTNVDLAGEFEPWHGIEFDHIRILKDIYPPRMDLEFRLSSADGKTISEGKRHLQELGYLMLSTLPTSDPLRYDKEMIRSWMRQEFKRSS